MFLLLKALTRRQLLPLSLVTIMLTVILTALLIILALIRAIETRIAEGVRPLVGADITISQNMPFASGARERLFTLVGTGAITERIRYDSNLTLSGGSYRAAEISIVTGEYPFYGGFTVTPIWNTGSARVWIDAKTYPLLVASGTLDVMGQTLAVNGTTESSLSSDFGFDDEAEITIDRSLLSESFSLTGIARIQYEYLVKVDMSTAELRKREELMESDTLFSGARIRLASSGESRTQDVVSELTSLIRLTLMWSIAIAGAFFYGILLRWSRSIRSTIALTRLYGASRIRLIVVVCGMLSILFLGALTLSVTATHFLLLWGAESPLLSGFFIGVQDILRASCVALMILALTLFQSAPPLITTPPLTLLGEESFRQKTITELWFSAILWVSILTLASIIIWEPWFIALISILAALSFIAVAVWGVRKFLAWVFSLVAGYKVSNFSLYEAMRRHVRPGSQGPAMVAALSILTSVLVGIGLFAYHLQSTLDMTEENTYSLFITNIPTAAIDEAEKYTKGQWGDFYRVILARIESVNDRSLKEHLGRDEVPREFGREFNITDSPLDEKYEGGRPLTNPDEVTVEGRFAENLGIAIGDSITFMLAGRSFPLRVVGIRQSFDGKSARPFFVFEVHPEAFAWAPRIAFAAFASGDSTVQTSEMIRIAGANLRIVDVGKVSSQIQDILSSILTAVTSLWVYITALAVSAFVSILTAFWALRSLRDFIIGYLGGTLSAVKSMNRIELISLLSIGVLIGVFVGIIGAITLIEMSEVLEVKWWAIMLVWAFSLPVTGLTSFAFFRQRR